MIEAFFNIDIMKAAWPIVLTGLWNTILRFKQYIAIVFEFEALGSLYGFYFCHRNTTHQMSFYIFGFRLWGIIYITPNV